VRYNNPGHVSSATGGDGDIVKYLGDAIARESLAHEMGHNLATANYGRTAPDQWSRFHQAYSSGEQPWTAYARSSIYEDFAESVKEYVTQPDVMRSERPLRSKAIDELLRQSQSHGQATA
jgi:hypothetical protein